MFANILITMASWIHFGSFLPPAISIDWYYSVSEREEKSQCCSVRYSITYMQIRMGIALAYPLFISLPRIGCMAVFDVWLLLPLSRLIVGFRSQLSHLCVKRDTDLSMRCKKRYPILVATVICEYYKLTRFSTSYAPTWHR